MITPPIGIIDATPLGLAVMQVSFNSSTGDWTPLSYWNFTTQTWETTFVANNHVRPLKRCTANQADINYKLMLWACPPEPLAWGNAVAVIYRLDSVTGAPTEIADIWNRQLLQNFLGYNQP